MAQKILIKRGVQANLGAAVLSAGEPAFVTDTGLFYVYDGTNKKLIGRIDSGTTNPTAAAAGRMFWNTTDGVLYRDNGTGWDAVGATSLADLTGTLDDISDGTNYQRVAATEVDASGRVTQLNDGANTVTAAQGSTAYTHSQVTTGNPHSVTKTDVGLGNVPNVDTTNASNIISGTLPSSVLPPIAVTSVSVVASEVAQLALTAQEGDVAVRSDLNKSYMHNGGSAGTMADWTELRTPTDAVLSVNGQTGTVVLTTGDISESANNNYVTDTEKTAVSNLSGVNTGDVTVLDSAEIDFTLTGQQITASLVAGSIDETKLDTSVNASLDLADSSLQSSNFIDDDTMATATATTISSSESIKAYVDAATSATTYTAGDGIDITSNVVSLDISAYSTTGNIGLTSTTGNIALQAGGVFSASDGLSNFIYSSSGSATFGSSTHADVTLLGADVSINDTTENVFNSSSGTTNVGGTATTNLKGGTVSIVNTSDGTVFNSDTGVVTVGNTSVTTNINGSSITVSDGVDIALSLSSGILNIGTSSTTTTILGGTLDINSSWVTFSGSTAAINNLLDEDDMASNSDTALVTQQSVKAYVDTQDATKADKVSGATAGNLATLDASGNLVDSSKSVNDSGTTTTSLWTANKIQNVVDSAVTGISWKEPVDEIATAPTGNEVGVDGFRVLIDGTGSGAFLGQDNAIATWDDTGTSWSFTAAAANYAVFNKADDAGYTYDADTTSWVQFTGAGQVVAGTGLSKSGNTISANLGAGIKELPTDEIGIDVYSTGGLITTVDGSTSSSVTGATLAIKADVTTTNVVPLNLSANGAGVLTDGSTVENNSGTLRVKALGITANEIAADAVTAAKINADVAGAGLVPNGATGALDVNGGNGISVTGDAVAVAADVTGGANLATVVNVSSNGVAVRIDDVTIKEDGSNQLYVDTIDGGTF